MENVYLVGVGMTLSAAIRKARWPTSRAGL